MAHEHKAGGETDEKGNDESGNMRFKGDESKV
jgi:hypothetical protein